VKHGNRICKHSPTVSEKKIKERIMDTLELTEYDEKIARQWVGKILVLDNA